MQIASRIILTMLLTKWLILFTIVIVTITITITDNISNNSINQDYAGITACHKWDNSCNFLRVSLVVGYVRGIYNYNSDNNNNKIKV